MELWYQVCRQDIEIILFEVLELYANHIANPQVYEPKFNANSYFALFKLNAQISTRGPYFYHLKLLLDFILLLASEASLLFVSTVVSLFDCFVALIIISCASVLFF
jgi:hypothetical protein